MSEREIPISEDLAGPCSRTPPETILDFFSSLG